MSPLPMGAEHSSSNDLEADATTKSDTSRPESLAKGSLANDDGVHDPPSTARRYWTAFTRGVSLEGHGVQPLTEHERSDAKFIQNFTIWVSMNATISAFSTGTLGPVLFGLTLRDSVLTILLFNIFSCAGPAYFAIFGPKLGMRQMAIARYSYGYFGAILPALLNLISFIGFCAINSIAAGQVLAAINPGSISINVGIVIIAVVSMVISFCGYRVMHACERWAWIPVIISFILLAGFGGRHLGAATSYNAGAGTGTAGNVLSWASIVVGFSLSWCGCAADFNTYMRPNVPSIKVFLYTFFGLFLSCVLIQSLGAAFGAAALSEEVMSWTAAYTDGGVGGLMGEALLPLKWFGKILLVFFAVGMVSNNAPTIYAFSLSLQIVFPFLTALPRWLFPLVGTAIYLPIAIVGAQHFETALSNFLGLLGYWSALFAAIVFVEHIVFRQARYSAYDITIWDNKRSLPTGTAALFSSFVGAGLVVLSMDQVWWRGPIAKLVTGPEATHGGDLSIWLGMASAIIVYLPTRWFERRWLRSERA